VLAACSGTELEIGVGEMEKMDRTSRKGKSAKAIKTLSAPIENQMTLLDFRNISPTPFLHKRLGFARSCVQFNAGVNKWRGGGRNGRKGFGH
jgi:hypothetical protein